MRTLLILFALSSAVSAQTPEVLFRQAEKLERDGAINRAVDAYTEFITKFPDHSQILEARFRLGKALDAIGKIDEAIVELETVVRESEKRRFRKAGDAMYTLGKLFGSLKEHEKAIDVFEKLLAKGADLYEDEVLNLTGGYYAVLEKYAEAAAKFNILKRRPNSKYAENAAYKLAMIWVKAEKLDLAVAAVGDLASSYPNNQHARGLMLQIADVFRRNKEYQKTIAVCLQLKNKFPRTQEGQGAGYIIALCYRDQGKSKEAAEALIEAGRLVENQKTGLATEAMYQAAAIYYNELKDVDKAIELYEETTKVARAERGQRQTQILEHCYFRLAEHYYAQSKWGVALEYYLLLRQLGTKINILPRILRCQTELDVNMNAAIQSEAEVEFLKKKIAENPGTFMAAEGEVFLADRKFEQGEKSAQMYDRAIEMYRGILGKYSPQVLAEQHLNSYVHAQIGRAYARQYAARKEDGVAGDEWRKSIDAFKACIETHPQTPYKIEALESICQVADVAGQTDIAFQTYQQLYEITEQRLEDDKNDAEAKGMMSDYVRAMLSRAEKSESIDKAIAVANRVVDTQGLDSEAAKHAKFYLAELLYLKKDFSAAAKGYREYITLYGPKPDAKGDIQGGPWKPDNVDAHTQTIYDAAVRVAHCWYMQGHNQNMFKAYMWMSRNFPWPNKYIAEAEYWINAELLSQADESSEATRLKYAELFWKKVCHPSLEFHAKSFKQEYHPWLRDAQMIKYVQAAMMKSGELYGSIGDHDIAANIFREYLRVFAPPQQQNRRGNQPPPVPDDKYSVARYALGLECVALDDLPGVVEAYKPFIDGLRDDRFRGSALQLLGHHASRGTDEVFETGINAFATLLDEYGKNTFDTDGNPIPVPMDKRIRNWRTSWNGIKMGLPEGVELGKIRYNLGMVYWRDENWVSAIKALSPFLIDREIVLSESRAKALYMLGQAYYRLHRYSEGLPVLAQIIQHHSDFEAVEEVCVNAAMGCVEVKSWKNLIGLHDMFVSKFPQSLRRAHMDLYRAIATLHEGDSVEALTTLDNITKSDTYEDVKAEAFYYLGIHFMDRTKPRFDAASSYLNRSVQMYPQPHATLAAAKCSMSLQQWDKAKEYLDMTLRDFPKAKPAIHAEAKLLHPKVLKNMAKNKQAQ